MASIGLVWDRIREFARSGRIYQQERVFQDQSGLDRVITGAEISDFSQQSAIVDNTILQINRLQRYRDYELMDQMGEISLALDLYADEISLIDPEHKHSLVIKANNMRIRAELEDLFFSTLLIDRQIRPLARYICKYGDAPFEIVPDQHRESVTAIKPMNVYNFTRLETRHGDLVGFFFQDEQEHLPIFLHPWQCMHLRLSSFEDTFQPYGRSIIEGGRKAAKQLKLMEEAALIYRLTRAPERRKFMIPVGMIPPAEVPEYMQAIARGFKRQRLYNQSTGTFDERYSPIIQEDDFFLPVRADGTGPDITTLPGAENLDQIADIEYFKKKMIAPTKIPFARVGIGEGGGEANEKSLSQSHAEFAKAVRWVQSEIALGLTKVAIVHLMLRGYSIEDCKGFELSLASTSALEDLYRMETWQSKTAVMAALKDLNWFPKEWIVTRFTDLSPDEIEELKDMEEEETGGGGGGGGIPPMGGDIPEGDDLGGEDMEMPTPPAPGEDSGQGPDIPLDSDAEAGGDDELSLEGYNYDREKRLLREFARFKGRQLRRTRYENTKIVSPAFYLAESLEFDGLSRDTNYISLQKDESGSLARPKPAGGMLFESSIADDVAAEVITEYAAVMSRTPPQVVEVIANGDMISAEISPTDFPTRS